MTQIHDVNCLFQDLKKKIVLDETRVGQWAGLGVFEAHGLGKSGWPTSMA